jgi:oxygen-independent coproporphyrinogen-3 oxidase
MFAIPGQTIQNWRDTLREALALQSEHLSCYEVIYEEDTPLFAQLKARKFDVDEDLACVMYEEFVNSAAGAGFHQYEVANFARDRRASAEKHAIGAHSVPDVAAAAERLAGEGSLLPSCACRHNVNYWRGGAYYGLGPSAAGYVRGVRMRNWANTQLYCEQLEKGRRAIESSEELNPLARAGETAAFGLRMTSGWLFAEFLRTTGHDLRQEWRADMDEIVARGWGRLTSERFCLTSKGLRFADAAAELFLR